MTTYRCDDGNAEITIEADSAREAAQEYVDGGDWGDSQGTILVYVWTVCAAHEEPQCEECEHADDRDSYSVTIPVEEPECEAAEHDWRSPIALVGGIKENPGVWSHGAGITYHEVCAECGMHRHGDTAATDMSDGSTYERITYEPATEESLAWVARRKTA